MWSRPPIDTRPRHWYRALYSRTSAIERLRNWADRRGRGSTQSLGGWGLLRMRYRPFLLVTTLVLAVGLMACGRATEEQINQALGITPTPTPSPEEIASATAAAAATELAQLTEEAAPQGAPLRGDVTRGQMQFMTQCSGCHGPGGQGGNILEPGGPGAEVSSESLLPLIREGVGHPEDLVFSATEITDSQVENLAAFIRSRATP